MIKSINCIVFPIHASTDPLADSCVDGLVSLFQGSGSIKAFRIQLKSILSVQLFIAFQSQRGSFFQCFCMLVSLGYD